MEESSKQPTTIDEYIAQFPPAVQTLLREVRTVIREAAPAATERIAYGMPTFYLNGNLVHFGVGKHHLGFYPTPAGITAFKDEFGAYKWSKGAVQFPLDQPIPYDLIRRITRYRVTESLTRK